MCVPFAGGPLEQRSRSVDQGAGLSGLGLGAAAVAELRAQRQELARSVCGLSRRQPAQNALPCEFSDIGEGRGGEGSRKPT